MHVAIALAEGLRGICKRWNAGSTLLGDFWASGLLIYERVKYHVVEGIFQLSANLIRECSCGWSIALEFWKSDWNASFGRELCQGCSARLFTHTSSPKLLVPRRVCSSQGTLLWWQVTRVAQMLLLWAFLCGHFCGITYMCKQGYLTSISKWYCKHWQTPLKCFQTHEGKT